jgi:hypothetical protein
MEIEEQMRDAEVVAESQVMVEADKGLDMEEGYIKPARVKSAGYVKIYDTRTGEMSLCNRNMLRHHLEKRRPDNSVVFTTVKPKFAPKRGHLKCMLHPDSPNREHYNELGLPVCMKSNLTSPYQVLRHMQKRHKVEYATIKEEEIRLEKEKDRAEKEKDRKLQESLIKLGSKQTSKKK